MPQNCCVPVCTKKVYEEDAIKISKCLLVTELFRKWIVAIQRDNVKEYRVTDHHMRICSRHFNQVIISHHLQAVKKPQNHQQCRLFFWKQGSLVKRKPPKKRSPVKPKIVVKGLETKHRERGKCKYSYH